MAMVDDTWARRELPILLACYRRVEEGSAVQSVGSMEEMREEIGLSPRDFRLGIEALANAEPPFVDVQFASGWSDEKVGGGIVDAVTERGRRALGAWPSGDALAERLIEALLAAAEKEEDPGEAEKLRRAAGDLGSAAVKSVFVTLFTKFVLSGLPEVS